MQPERCACLCHSGSGHCGVGPCCEQAGTIWPEDQESEEEKTSRESIPKELKEQEADKK